MTLNQNDQWIIQTTTQKSIDIAKDEYVGVQFASPFHPHWGQQESKRQETKSDRALRWNKDAVLYALHLLLRGTDHVWAKFDARILAFGVVVGAKDRIACAPWVVKHEQLQPFLFFSFLEHTLMAMATRNSTVQSFRLFSGSHCKNCSCTAS